MIYDLSVAFSDNLVVWMMRELNIILSFISVILYFSPEI